MGSAARALVCSDLPETTQSLLRIVERSPALQSIGVARCRVEAMELMPMLPDVLVVDARLDCDAGLSFSEKVGGPQTPVLLVVEPGTEGAARALAVARGRSSVFAVGRDVVERGEASSDAVVRTRLCLLAANARNGATQAARSSRHGTGQLEALVEAPYGAVVLLGSAGTPHLLPKLLPKTRVGASPLVVAVHHNPRFSDDFVHWVGELCGRPARCFDADAVAAAGPGELFVAPSQPAGDGPGELSPDLGGLLATLVGRGVRLLACVASGMEDPVGPALVGVANGGGRVVALAAEACSQPAMADAARHAGVVAADLSVDAIAGLIQSARARETP